MPAFAHAPVTDLSETARQGIAAFMDRFSLEAVKLDSADFAALISLIRPLLTGRIIT